MTGRMRIVRGMDGRFPTGKPAYVCIGVFDGVHLGHQAFLNELVAWARERGGRAVALTFQRHPLAVLAGAPPTCLTSLEHRLRIFESLGIDVCVTAPFDRELARMKPEDFVRDVLCDWMGARGVQVGYDQRFGSGGRGDVDLLRRIAPELGLEARVAAAVEARGAPISSTAIREAVVAGDLARASAMLGRPVSVLGRVSQGAHKGREIGFPTANLDTRNELRLPDGVYAVEAVVGGRALPGVANIGPRPTFEPDGPAYADSESVVEVYLLDFDGDLYGRDIEARFLKKLRDEMPFRDPARLAEQIASDVAAAREYFSG